MGKAGTGTLAVFLLLMSLAGSVIAESARQEAYYKAVPEQQTNEKQNELGRYTVERNEKTITLSTAYYTIEHNLKKGGAISRITLTHGKADNLLAAPVKTSVQNAAGDIFDDLNNAEAVVSYRKDGKTEIITVECGLTDKTSNASGIKTKTIYEYHWGYIKIHKEFYFPPQSVKIKTLNVLSTVFDKNLSEFGYREGITQEQGEDPFSFGICHWGKTGNAPGPALNTHYVPRYLVLADPAVEGIEWFVGSNLTLWDTQCTGKIGDGLCNIALGEDDGVAVSIAPLHVSEQPVTAKEIYQFDYYVGVPLLKGHANKVWLHTAFNRRGGGWVSQQEIEGWEQSGISDVHCHNDGGEPNSIYWRDGTYPPYPSEDMKKFDDVITMCHQHGIKVTTYFSNKELHPITEEYKTHGPKWARQDCQHNIKFNYSHSNKKSLYGVQMCLDSGWLDFLKFSIDRVLKNHALDGVYYDWNVALLCHSSHTGTDSTGKNNSSEPAYHWDIDGLINLMEWTRERVGPDGVVIIHNTQTPMFVTENFADYVVATEWGYQKWTDRPAKLQELPLEWSFVNARPRGTISYLIIDPKSPRRFHKVFALESFVSGVAPWSASAEAIELNKKLKPLGNLEQYKFADWRNKAVSLNNDDCACAIYSRSGQAYILLANLGADDKEINCTVDSEKLPCPLSSVGKATIIYNDNTVALDAAKLIGSGEKITVPGDDMILLYIEETK